MLPRSAHGPVRAEVLEPTLRRLLEQRPDSIVGLLVRLEREASARDSADLRALGLTITSVRGTVLTGRARARSALELSRLRAVQWIEVSMSISPVRRPRPLVPRQVREARRQ
jgi:hypothetical protein